MITDIDFKGKTDNVTSIINLCDKPIEQHYLDTPFREGEHLWKEAIKYNTK